MGCQHLLPALAQRRQLQGSVHAEVELFHIESTCLAMEEQAGLHARQRIEILQQRAVGVCKLRGTVGYLSQQTIQAFLRELQQGEILGNIGEEIILCTHSQPTFIEKRCVSEVIVSKSSYCI